MPIEIGKFNHKAAVVNFFGDVLVKPFEFANKQHELKFFLKKVKTAAKSASSKKIFLGCGHYHLNLVYHIQQSGLLVEVINPPRYAKGEPE